jgi:hypothetical protein
MNSYVFWAISPCSPMKVNRRFGGTYYLHPQNRKRNEGRNKYEAGGQTELCILIDPKDGCDIFLRNIS